MAFAMANTLQHTPAVASAVPTLRRSAFTGAVAPLMTPIISRQARTSICTPQALFTRNKQEDKNRKTGYDKKALEIDPAQPAFTRRREVFAGRLAMIGFASALIGEILTGEGPLGQLQLELGLPDWGVDLLVLGIVGYSFVGGLRPGSPTFSEANQRDVRKRGAGPTQKPQINAVEKPGKFFGVTEFGFSKKNEVFVGRTAQLGFLAAVIGEKITGKGILRQIGLETGIPIGQTSVFLVAFISFFLLAALFNGNYGESAIDDDATY